MELKTLSNAELFERWRRELGFRYRTERPRKEAIRFASLFERFLGGYPPSANLAKQFLSGYLDRKQNTRAGYYAQLAMFMKWYGDPIDDCRVSPAEEMPELVDSRDLDRIEEAIRNRKTHKKLIQRDILLVRTLRYTGMRRAEAAHLRVCDIDFAGRMLMVRGGKGCKDRAIPMLDSLMTEMQTYCAAKQREDLVFGLKDVSVSGLVSIWAHKAGVPHIHAHSYRHFFGTELARKGASARAIMILMGHKSMQTSQRYIDLVADDLRSAIDRLSEPQARPEGTDTGKAESPTIYDFQVAGE
ncbi:MAG: site-specific integrase [Dehalococcoidia bacterium]|nr:site-specific integrase [Dehalococcoidia bacterium]